MLNPEEAAVVHAALRSAIEETQRYREQYGTSLESALASGAGAYGTQQALALYEQITGYSESDAEVLWHHDISKFGPACRTCGKPPRTASAKKLGGVRSSACGGLVGHSSHRLRYAGIRRPSLRLARLSVCINPMDPRLATLIDDYIASVSSAVKLLERGGIARPESNTAWACADISQTGVLPGGVKYFKHGYGCAVHLKRGLVDFDFGERGEINGFDVWRLASFANERLGQYRFSSEKELEACFKAEASAGTLVYSGYILYYLRHAGA
jgi:hypothetical protein